MYTYEYIIPYSACSLVFERRKGYIFATEGIKHN